MSDEQPTPDIPMWVHLRVCECGRVGEWAKTRCGRDGRHNMFSGCPTVQVMYDVNSTPPVGRVVYAISKELIG